MKLIKIVHELRKASGSNAKIKILKKYKDNELWKKFLLYTYDERKTYGISTVSSLDFDIVDIDENMFDAFDELSSRNITGKSAKSVANSLSKKYGEIPRLILNRSIKAGISSTTINKVYDNLIPIFKSMKGMDCPIKRYPVESSIKFDGVKVFARVENQKVTLCSSSGTEFTLKSLERDMLFLCDGVYEGELIYQEGKQIHRTKISGKLNSLLAGTIDDITAEYYYMVYDMITLKEWDEKQSITSFEDRQKLLTASFGDYDLRHANKVFHDKLFSINEVEEYYNRLADEGYEGSMHRYFDDVYEWKRVDKLVKKKAIKECVLKCVGITPHSNPSKGNIGSLICKGQIIDKELGQIDIEVNVGSGLSKFDIQFSEERYIGENIELIYNTVTKTEKGYSLFLPRFKRVQK